MTDQESAPEETKYDPGQYMLYKLDRTLAILGLVGIAVGAMVILGADAKDVCLAATGGLVGYIGGRAGAK